MSNVHRGKRHFRRRMSIKDKLRHWPKGKAAGYRNKQTKRQDYDVPVRGRVGEREAIPFKACSAARLLSASISFNRSASLRFVISDCNISSKSLTASLDLETSRLALASCSDSRIEVETASADVRRRVAISSRICFTLGCSKVEKGGSWRDPDDRLSSRLCPDGCRL